MSYFRNCGDIDKSNNFWPVRRNIVGKSIYKYYSKFIIKIIKEKCQTKQMQSKGSKRI
jgi:hypothetical protein